MTIESKYSMSVCWGYYVAYFNVSYCVTKILKAARSALSLLGADFTHFKEETKKTFYDIEKDLSVVTFTLHTIALPKKAIKSLRAFERGWSYFSQAKTQGSIKETLLKVSELISCLFRGLYYLITTLNGLIFKPIALVDKYFSISDTAKLIGKQAKILQSIAEVAKLFYLIADVIQGKKIIRNLIEIVFVIFALVIGILIIAKVSLPVLLIVTIAIVNISSGVFKAWEKASKICSASFYNRAQTAELGIG